MEPKRFLVSYTKDNKKYTEVVDNMLQASIYGKYKSKGCKNIKTGKLE